MPGFLKKVIKGLLIGGGTILSLLCPPAGGAVITAGMAIGAGAVAAGSLLKTESPVTVDTTVATVTDTLQSLGLMEPAGYVTKTGPALGITSKGFLYIAAGIVLLFLLFLKRRRR